MKILWWVTLTISTCACFLYDCYKPELWQKAIHKIHIFEVDWNEPIEYVPSSFSSNKFQSNEDTFSLDQPCDSEIIFDVSNCTSKIVYKLTRICSFNLCLSYLAMPQWSHTKLGVKLWDWILCFNILQRGTSSLQSSHGTLEIKFKVKIYVTDSKSCLHFVPRLLFDGSYFLSIFCLDCNVWMVMCHVTI